ncbi:MAG: hypothetical protein AAF822_09065 [Pseudomonadota bacterium]
MKTETFIDALLRKYQQAPNFPFHDWTTNSVSFYALINLWDELFKTAAGQQVVQFEALRDVEMDIDSLIYDVGTQDRTRRVSVYPEQDGGTFNLFFKEKTDGYRPERAHLGDLPDRTSLEFATDLQANRLVACFDIIRTYLSTACPDSELAAELEARLIKTHRHVFGFSDFNPFEGRDENGRYVQPSDEDDKT